MTQLPHWPRRALQAAAIYNLLWGAWVILMPNHWFDLTGIPRPNYPGIWQCVGMIVGVYGLGYWWASKDFSKHWPVIAVGFLGKIFGPIGFVQSVLTGALPWSWGWMILTNDLIWWVPFGAMLYLAFKINSDPSSKPTNANSENWTIEQANQIAKTANGESIAELSSKQDVLLVFLRHAGCTFCRETLDELSKARPDWTRQALVPVIVHMGSVSQGVEMMSRYQLGDCPVISDPDCKLFRAYHLPRGTWRQLFGLRVWIEGFKAAILKGYGFGKLVGDGFQMSGTFVVHQGQVLRAYPSKDAADSCSWRPALLATLLAGFWILISDPSLAIAQSEQSNPGVGSKGASVISGYCITDVKEGDQVVADKTLTREKCLVLQVHSQKGIGSFKLKRTSGAWNTTLKIRLHTKGLEQIQVVLGDKNKAYVGEYSTSSLAENWAVVKQEATRQGEHRSTTSAWDARSTIIRVLGTDSKEIVGPTIPLSQSEHFECSLPSEWLTDSNPEWIEIKWVDFFR